MSVFRIFLAGASGAIGRRLIPLLLEAGHSVVGTTRTPAKADALRAAGIKLVSAIYNVAQPDSYATTTRGVHGAGMEC
jgi:uncharacterized protein YbjT (DUF2867 family)